MTDDEIRDHERNNILAALKASAARCLGNDGAAELLAIKPTTLASRIKSLGISARNLDLQAR